MVEPNTSLTVTGDIDFYLEPYQEDVYSDEQSIRYTNTGNVKARLDVEYDDEDLTHDVSQEIFEPGESADITFQYYSSNRGLVEFGTDVSIGQYPLGKLDLEAEGNIGVGSRGGRTLTIGVTVGYQGYKQAQGDNYEVQYRDSIELEGNTQENLTFYVYPHEEIYFDVTGSDVEIIDVSMDTDELLTPRSEGEEEVEITVHFESNHQNDGTIDLILDGDHYTTAVQLTETAPKPGNEEVSFVEEEAETITLGIILIGGIVIIGAARIFLSKKDEEDD